ncbi:MAG: PilZ domain-containing protein [Sphingomonas sp.]
MHLTVEQRRLARIKGRARASCARQPSESVRAWLRAAPDEAVAASGPGALRLEAESEPGSERRVCGRRSVESEFLVRRTGGFNCQSRLRDISTHGCGAELTAVCDTGDHVVTRFPDLEPLGARVCWTDGVTAGLQFVSRIHPAVLDSLLTRLG